MEKYPLRTQLLSCAVLAAIGLAIIQFGQDLPLPQALAVGMPWQDQLGLGAALGLAVSLVSAITTLRRPAAEAVQRTTASYSRLDLSGWNPLWISLGAGISEEILFRAALQPLVGIWGASLLFLLAHVRAYEFRRLDGATLLQAGGVFGMALMFGFGYEYIGLLAMVVAHTIIDIVGLLLVQRIAEGANRLR
ncbi:CPBP family intramembrane glutamic endopeptidase [Pseudoduganella sp. OTU4001]|uniref:CPBP family intramembrane glutamic endopeptidase n=1 Tax=Pseudoduganella sp. OTU4001 TaxID=3043854 RepID=UPI00313AC7F6